MRRARRGGHGYGRPAARCPSRTAAPPEPAAGEGRPLNRPGAAAGLLNRPGAATGLLKRPGAGARTRAVAVPSGAAATVPRPPRPPRPPGRTVPRRGAVGGRGVPDGAVPEQAAADRGSERGRPKTAAADRAARHTAVADTAVADAAVADAAVWGRCRAARALADRGAPRRGAPERAARRRAPGAVPRVPARPAPRCRNDSRSRAGGRAGSLRWWSAVGGTADE